MTISECLAAFSDEILIETVALWASIGIGIVLVLLFAFMAISRSRNSGTGTLSVAMMAMLVIGLGVLFFAFTGKVYAVAGGLAAPELSQQKANMSTKKWCVQQASTTADPVPEDPQNFAGWDSYADPEYQAAREGLAALDPKDRLVWIYYAPRRADDAAEMRELLRRIGMTTAGSEDPDFAAVRNKPPAGTTRIVYDDGDLTQAVGWLEIVLRHDLNAWTQVDGPFGLKSGPIQMQLF